MVNTRPNLVVNFAPTGLIPTREMTPHVPVSVQEIVEDVHRAVELGITMVHLHAREEKTGQTTFAREIYKLIIAGIRKIAPDLVVCVSLSGRQVTEVEKRMDPLCLEGELQPDMGSLTLSSLNFNRHASVNSPEVIQRLAREMKKRGIVPELEVFDAGMINYAGYLEKKGLLSPPHYFNLILGNISCAQADLLHLGVMVRDLPECSLWSAGGVGRVQLQVNALAVASGGGVRVGLEDNIWYDCQRTRLATNADLLQRVHLLAQINERTIMKPVELRELLHLEPGHGKYGRKKRGDSVDT